MHVGPAQAGISHAPWLGYALLVGASLCEAAYSVIGKKLTAALGPKRITALINLWGFMLATPFGLYLALDFDFGAVPWTTWSLLVFYALAACMWTVWLWMSGLKVVPAAQGGVFTVLLPVSAALVGVVVLGEHLSAMQWAAFGIALASVVLATLPSRLAWRVGPADKRHRERSLTTTPSASAYSQSPGRTHTPCTCTATSACPSPRLSVGKGMSPSARMPTGSA